jgi:nicotinate-nucleotide adenylyltransferase
MRLGIFGGTFDPIHSAHLVVAREALAAFALDRVLFVPAGRPPHKSDSTLASFDDRFRMVELACAGETRFEVSRIERGESRSYSIDTIERLRATLAPGDRLFFLIGADAFAEIATWRRWRDVVEKVEFIVATRPGHGYETPPGATVHRLETVALPVSSSEIRQRLAAGEATDQLPEPVLDYIRSRGLYRR